MQNIELFKEGQEGAKESPEKNNARIDEKRPEWVKITRDVPTPNRRWRECKIIGKNI